MYIYSLLLAWLNLGCLVNNNNILTKNNDYVSFGGHMRTSSFFIVILKSAFNIYNTWIIKIFKYQKY